MRPLHVTARKAALEREVQADERKCHTDIARSVYAVLQAVRVCDMLMDEPFVAAAE